MGGSLSVRDNPGGGSVFRWTFELAAAAAHRSRPPALREALQQHAATVPPLHCLVFEDLTPIGW